MSERGARDQVRAEAERRHPSNHTVDDPFGATGEAQSDEYGYEEYARNAFIAGADWQASRKVEVTEEMVRRGALVLDPAAFSDPLVGYGEGAAAQSRESALELARGVLTAALGGGD